MHETLLLNTDYTPIRIIPWTRAVCLWFSDKVEVVEEYDDFDLKSINFTIKCPAVVRLLKYVSHATRRVKFSRVNVFSRDNFTCQYCQAQPGTQELTYDHVTPRAQGGVTVWENIVTACLSCNALKRNRTPEEAGMKLLKVPKKPEDRQFYQFSLHLPKTPDAWRSYLYWMQELENDHAI
jgi:5-methylcytosine-specific restriction endonuclease McrA